MNEDSDDSLTNILKEEEQQQLQQVGGHGAQDKAQAMQVNLTTQQAHEQTSRQTKNTKKKHNVILPRVMGLMTRLKA